MHEYNGCARAAANRPRRRPLSVLGLYTTYCYNHLAPLFHGNLIHASAFTINWTFLYRFKSPLFSLLDCRLIILLKHFLPFCFKYCAYRSVKGDLYSYFIRCFCKFKCCINVYQKYIVIVFARSFVHAGFVFINSQILFTNKFTNFLYNRKTISLFFLQTAKKYSIAFFRVN